MSWCNAIGPRENAKIMRDLNLVPRAFLLGGEKPWERGWRDLVAVVLAEYEGCTNNVWIMVIKITELLKLANTS